MHQSELIKDINGENGYSLHLKLSDQDLSIIQKMIRIQFLYRLQLLIPKEVYLFNNIEIARYHEFSHLINHAEAWPKYARVLPREAVAIIKEMEFFKKLKMAVGDFTISDEESFGWENIYWRLVRPGNSDYGSLHADKWFWDLGSYGKVADYPHERLKIWMAVHTVCGKNGLRVVPGSHRKKDWKWHMEMKNGLKKPVLDENEDSLDLELLPTEPGQTVVFHDELIHGGAINLADKTRVSLEFTLLVPLDTKEKLLNSFPRKKEINYDKVSCHG
jgi:hypothetical protein